MTEALKQASELIESVRRARPGAYALARVVSLAARIEPALIRQARIELLPRLDAGDEADLWFSPLVQARSPLAIVFAPEVAETLRGELAKDGNGARQLGDDLARERTLLRRAWDVVRRVHAKASPVIRLEEEVTYLALSDEPDASQKIHALLLSAALTMAEGDGRELAQWALRALPRLPEEVRDSEAAWTLAVGAGARLGGRRILAGELPDAIAHNRLRWVLPRDHKQTKVGVRLVEAGVEISEPPAEGAHAIELPKTDPLFLEVSWGEVPNPTVRPVTLRPGQTQTIETGALTEVSISTPTGEFFNIRREYEFDVFIDSMSADTISLEEQIASRLQSEEWKGRRLKVARPQVIGMHPDMGYMSEEVLQGFGEAFEANREEAARNRRASRKVIEEINEDKLKRLSAPSQSSGDEANDPRLIRIYLGTTELPPELGKYVDVDFRDESRFEYNYRKLLARIKDEPFTEPPDAPTQSKPLKLYYAYVREDEKLKQMLAQHLRPLEQEGIIEERHGQVISEDWDGEVEGRLYSADLILLLLSTDFLNSEFAHNVEMKRALERHEAGEARILPIILRPCAWIRTPLGRFQPLPPEGRPVTSWSSPDEAFQLVAEGVRRVALEMTGSQSGKSQP